MKFKSPFSIAKLTASLALLGLAGSSFANNAVINLRVIETTDIHAYFTAYDYLKDQPVLNYGLTRTASLIKQARAQATNSVLVDNGDLIQGGLIGTWAVDDNFKSYKIHPAYLGFKALNYDVSNLGNHEFNYGLPYLDKVVATAQEQAGIPVINANVYDAKTGKNYYTPYIIKETVLTDTQGKKHKVKIGYIGFTPPQIMQWDAEKLTGKVTVTPIVQSALEFVPKMKAEGAEIIIAVPHSGIGSVAPSSSLYPNQVINLTKVPGIDAVAFGHSHGVFPSAEYKDVKGADLEKGWINGVPAVMPGRWGSHLGIIDLVLVQQADGSFKADAQQSRAFARPIYDVKNRQALVEEDAELVKVYASTHKAVRDYANAPLGKLEDNLYGYLALYQDDPAVKLVNQVQLATLKDWVAQNPEYKDYKLVSAAAPFKFGERHNDPANFTVVDKGTFAFRNVSDLYVYPNTFAIVKVTGRELKNWAECSAGMFNTIFTDTDQRQELINYRGFKTYNFDVLYGVNYQIDVTRPAKFTGSCRPTGNRKGRVENMTYNGQPIKDSDNFLVATNNYRANTGMFPGTGTDKVVYLALETSQEVIANYIQKQAKENKPIVLDRTVNWSLVPIKNGEKLNVVIFSAPDNKAVNYALNNSVWPLVKLDLDYAGFQEYRIDLSKYQPEKQYK
ncbi:bifunctional 2',3'-cyclic-nucleotide 2'-phosphodiesterase/3'-nucleotidase [Psittacicella gerlachiana]|uniref:2',3'-cyclic-nucleotide 2'-phosphodiesterase n=1 Tax=Psittacicella gerlachiana TaxID=2028574 RepID=A0A3A1YK68_9GAMM|nr:bifunctional 2',3'-cyclic-nucleotide 2'-phosphodiesterase/3'-nucleotidase [Psittacicella gerlachiana]RIY37856.1 2',3'-cyclic-nucleotide 2'-phosphodiesterase [Psittacicella gerlachiana]